MQIRNALIAAFVAAVVGFPPAVSANDLSIIDSQPSSPGRIVQDLAGNAYVTWTHRSSSALADAVMFCRIPADASRCTEPIVLPIPGVGDNTDAVSGAFPTIWEGNKVAVAAPRYTDQAIITWSSYNGGLTFTPGTAHPEAYPHDTDPSGVISLYGQIFFVGASNPGLGFGYTFAPLESNGYFQFASPGVGVGTSSLGFEGLLNPVMAYWTIGEPYKMSFYRVANEGSFGTESSWEGPIEIGNGYETKLASDAGRLFLVSQDYAGGPKPTRITVRKYLGTKFGAPVTVAEDASVDLFSGGAIAESPAGDVAVAWPSPGTGGQARVMRLFTSTDGGATFSGETQIARVADGYRIGDNAQMTVGENGAGWLTYLDAGGLHLADLNPAPAPVPSPAPKPKRYKGERKTIAKRVGHFAITLRLPKNCVLSQQDFSVGVGEKRRPGLHKRPGVELRLKKVALFYEGRKIEVRKKKPFRFTVDPGPLAPGSTLTVTAKVTATLTGKAKRTISRTLVGGFKSC